MTADRLAALRDLFERCEGLPRAARGAFVDRECPPELRDELLVLLASHETAGGFLSTPAGNAGVFAWHAATSADGLIGARLGAFEVLEEVGSGGMGAVYRARQANPGRDVALKVMRAGLSSPALLRRFEHEAAALARLRHPAIAQIYEAGSARAPDGRDVPYFAMEFVRGRTLTKFAEEHRPPLRARLDLFARVCDGVQHAHQKGVVHRDLKPANILVEVDAAGAPQPRILDFGVARLTDADVGAATMLTSAGQIVGTVPYMAPEQVRGDTDEIDQRTDVYALGVILFELVAGRLPYDVRGKPITHAAAVIAGEEPTRLSRAAPGVGADLDTIVRKALEKDPDRRYASAAELGADVRRFLDDLPIAARPPTTIYQARKFARRNRALTAALAASFVLLAAGVVGTGVGLVRARDGEREARAAQASAERVVEFLETMLLSADPEVARRRDVTVRDVLDTAAAGAAEAFADDPRVGLRTQTTLARSYLGVNVRDKAREHADAALALAGRVYGEGSLEHARALLVVARVDRADGRAAEAAEKVERAIAVFERGLGPDHAETAEARWQHASTISLLGKITDAAAELRAASAVLVANRSPRAPACLADLALNLVRSHKPENVAEARSILENALATARAAAPPDRGAIADLLITLADAQRRQRDYARAEASVREAITIRAGFLPADHPRMLGARRALLSTLRQSGKTGDALALGERLVADTAAAFDPNHPSVGDILGEVARCHEDLGDYAAARDVMARILRIADASGQPVLRSLALNGLAQCNQALGDHGAALGYIDLIIADIRASRNPAVRIGPYLTQRGESLLALGRDPEALAALEEAESVLREVGPEASIRALNFLHLGEHRLRAGSHAEAEAFLRRALEVATKNADPDSRAVCRRVRDALARRLAETGRAGEAAALPSCG
ncbi:MAG TPA: serine/threonine-protein kinase [Phycisphaerales bacterium]|nr:serine/threonine-protein kinase [Phycisphaerales bacterium]